MFCLQLHPIARQYPKIDTTRIWEQTVHMTRIVQSHRLAHQAVLAVSAILGRAGALTEIVKNDYGEDLLVQTQFKGEADTFNIFVQVKGANLRPLKDGRYQIRLDRDHVIRWISHSQPILLCIFDEQSGNVFAIYPRAEFSLWKLHCSTNKTMNIKFGVRNLFNEDNAKTYIWQCRMEHYSRMLAWYENNTVYARTHGLSASRRKKIAAERNMVVWTFIRSIGLLDGADKFHDDFRSFINNGSINFANEYKEAKDGPPTLRALFMLCFLAFVDKVAGCGLPANLLEHGTDMTGMFFKGFHPDDWSRAARRIGRGDWLSNTPSGKSQKKRASPQRSARDARD